jgi:hypothetical protein
MPTVSSVPDLHFEVQRAEAIAFAAEPMLTLKLRIWQPAARESGITIHSIVLRCQIRIEPARRRYSPEEQRRLADLFGTPDRWSQTLRPMLWAHTGAAVSAFTDDTVVDLPVPCTADFNIAAGRYFCALDDDAVPLCLLFSGTMFYQPEGAPLQAAPIPWDKEAGFRLPVQAWKEMMDHYFPNSAWLCLRRDTLQRLSKYKAHRGLPTWQQAVDDLLEAAAEDAHP